MRSMAVLIAIVSVSSPAFAADKWPDAYARRGIQLGISLSDFKAKPFPDLKDYPGASAVCSDEARSSDIRYATTQIETPSLEKAGVIKCGFYFTDSDMPPMGMDAGLGLLDAMLPTDFYFVPADDGQQRLFWIVTVGPTAMTPSLVPVMEKAYGPSAHKVEGWQNRMGAVFNNDVYEWSNASSRVKLKRIGDSMDSFDLEYTLNDLMKRFEYLADQQAAADAGKL